MFLGPKMGQFCPKKDHNMLPGHPMASKICANILTRSLGPLPVKKSNPESLGENSTSCGFEKCHFAGWSFIQNDFFRLWWAWGPFDSRGRGSMSVVRVLGLYIVVIRAWMGSFWCRRALKGKGFDLRWKLKISQFIHHPRTQERIPSPNIQRSSIFLTIQKILLETYVFRDYACLAKYLVDIQFWRFRFWTFWLGYTCIWIFVSSSEVRSVRQSKWCLHVRNADPDMEFVFIFLGIR